MAWPVKPRDMIFSGSGVLDRKNRAVLTMLRTLEDDEMYFGVKTPKAAPGHVRLEVKRAYHYFQDLDDGRTKYVTLFNTDPKVKLLPKWILKFVTAKIYKKLLKILKTRSVQAINDVYAERIKQK